MNSYDQVPYPTFVQEQTHPDRMHVIASLFGLSPAPVDACRVLEVGCGDGNNMIPLAYCCPKAKFVGIDLAEQAVSRGNEAIRALGLSNISLEGRDLTALPADFGEFDYIIAHGVYAWVPEFVRDSLLRMCREHIAPQGIAYISYNAMPGGHTRRVVRDLMLFHTRGIADADEKVRQAEAILSFAVNSTPRDDYFSQLLESRQKTIAEGTVLFHDDLGENYEPVYVEQFVAHAARHDLGYVGEADFFEMSDAMYPPAIREELDRLSAGDRIRKEQYMDFLSGRGFRQTLLCRSEVTPKCGPLLERLRRFHVSTTLKPTDVEGEFVTRGERKIKTNHPVIQEKLVELCAMWPASMPVESVTGADPLLENYLFHLYSGNFVQLHSRAPFFTINTGERPEASAVARFQALQSEFVATLSQQAARIEGETARKFLLKLDGTRTREELAEEMGKPLQLIEENLQSMARLGLILR
jgi:SAM-dependent methyltransferase